MFFHVFFCRQYLKVVVHMKSANKRVLERDDVVNMSLDAVDRFKSSGLFVDAVDGFNVAPRWGC